jgi:DUF1016 N-terminal domain
MTEQDLELKGPEHRELLIQIRALIEDARRQTAVAVNIGLTLLYWRIGKRIHLEVLGSERAAYGEQIVVTVSRQLVVDYGRGYSEKNLRRMVQFAEVFPEEEIVVTLPGSKAGVCVLCAHASIPCFMSVPHSRNNPMS